MTGKFQTINVNQLSDTVLEVTLDRPEVSNALNTRMAHELTEVFETLALDPNSSRVVLVAGAGDKAFCAGGDLKERNGMSDDDWNLQHLVFERMIRAVIACPVPLVGSINGAAYGGGCELAAALDFVYAVEHAKFAQTETRIGIIPGIGGTQNLARAIGERRAKELILSAKSFTATEAHHWGLVNAVYPTIAQMREAVLDIASHIAANAPMAVRQAKQAIHKGGQMSLSDGMAFEIEAYNRLVGSEDRREGVRAFNEKRPPVFAGR